MLRQPGRDPLRAGGQAGYIASLLKYTPVGAEQTVGAGHNPSEAEPDPFGAQVGVGESPFGAQGQQAHPKAYLKELACQLSHNPLGLGYWLRWSHPGMSTRLWRRRLPCSSRSSRVS